MKKPILLLLCVGLCGCVTAQFSAIELTTIRSDYVKYHSELSQKIKDAILGGKIFTGMTRDEIKASRPEYASCLNYPDSSSYSAWGSSTIYKCYHTYFSFFDDKLQSVNQFNY
jgi:hypothetical protein